MMTETYKFKPSYNDNKPNTLIPTIDKPDETSKPIIKRTFSNKAKEENEKYQAIRAENKELKSLLKMYNKTKTKNEEFKQLLKDNPLFSQDYERILDAYNNNIKLDIDTIKILALFGFEPL